MSSSAWLATWLDQDFLTRQGAVILDPLDSASSPVTTISRSGGAVAEELGGRKLLRFLTPSQLGLFSEGTSRQTFVTPTAYTTVDAASWLLLPPANLEPRTHVLILDPAKIDTIQGPM